MKKDQIKKKPKKIYRKNKWTKEEDKILKE